MGIETDMALGHHRANAARYLAEHIDGARLVEVPGNDALFFGGDNDQVIDEVAEFLTGQRPPFEVDRILTTVLFTDIVGSVETGRLVFGQCRILRLWTKPLRGSLRNRPATRPATADSVSV
jgi:hypothetical protein